MPDLDLTKSDGYYAHLHHGHDYDHKYAHKDHDHDEYIEHHECDKFARKSETASKGTAGAALGLGIAGTALGIWNAWKENNDRRYGRHGRGCDDCDDGYGYGRGYGRGGYCEEQKWWHREQRHERHYEMEQEKENSALRAVLAQQTSERFAEQGDFKNYKTLSRMIEEENEELARKVGFLSEKVRELQKCCAVSDAKAEGKFEVLKEGLKDFKEDLYGVKAGASAELRSAIALEAERREENRERERGRKSEKD